MNGLTEKKIMGAGTWPAPQIWGNEKSKQKAKIVVKNSEATESGLWVGECVTEREKEQHKTWTPGYVGPFGSTEYVKECWSQKWHNSICDFTKSPWLLCEEWIGKGQVGSRDTSHKVLTATQVRKEGGVLVSLQDGHSRVRLELPC